MSIQEIFTKKYYKIYDLTNEYVSQLIMSIFNHVGISEILKTQYCNIEDIKNKLSLHDQAIVPLRWMLLFLSNKNYLSIQEKDNNYYFKLEKSMNFIDPENIASEILCIDKDILPSNALLKSVSEEYPDFLLGRKTGLEILFSGDNANLWREYFSNDHHGYAVHNYFGAFGVVKWLPQSPKFKILEVGGGIGGASVSLLEILEKENLLANIKEYIFSDISPLFLRIGNKSIMEKFPNLEQITLKKLDFNKSMLEQKVVEESFDIVYGVNALHVANDLLFTLQELKRIIKSKGILVISECVRANDKSTPQPEFIFNLLDNYRNVKTDPSSRKTIGFLSPDNWLYMFKKAGFNNIEMILNSDIDGNIRYPAIAMIMKGEKT